MAVGVIMLTIARSGSSLGKAVIDPTHNSLIADYYPIEVRAKVFSFHRSANAVGGECETIKHRYGTLNPEEMRMEGAPRTIKFALGENPYVGDAFGLANFSGRQHFVVGIVTQHDRVFANPLFFDFKEATRIEKLVSGCVALTNE